MDSWFHAAVHSSDGNQKMVAEDPLRKLCLGRLKNVPAQVVCIALVALQAVLLNHHLQVTSDDVRLWSWFVGDAAVVASFVFTFYFREWRVKHVANKHQEPTGFSKGLPFGSISWLIYAILLGARVAVVFKKDLHSGHDIVDLKLTISITAIVSVLFTIGHHHHHESLARRAAILALAKMFTIDILDTVDILDVLFNTAINYASEFPVSLEDFVLAVVTLNLIRPTIVLLSLFVDHYAHTRGSKQVKMAKAFAELCLLNIPLLCIRVYISIKYKDQISVFLVKNILSIMYAIVEIYDCIFDLSELEQTDKAEANFVNVEKAYTNKACEPDEPINQETNKKNGVTSTPVSPKSSSKEVSF